MFLNFTDPKLSVAKLDAHTHFRVKIYLHLEPTSSLDRLDP